MDDKNFISKVIKNSIAVSIIAIIIISIINMIPNPWVPHNNDWISFYGSFAGAIISGMIAGFLTFEGVKRTIEYNEKTRKDDFRKSIRPFFQVIITTIGGEKEKKNYKIDNELQAETSIKNHITLKFKNIGMKSAINVRFKEELLSNAINVDEETQKITFEIKVNNGNSLDNNFYKFFIDFQDLAGNLYKQKYEIVFQGDAKKSEISPLNTLPEIQ